MEKLTSTAPLLNACQSSGTKFYHIIFQMGGRLDVQNEVLCRFVFPERPGALMKFLDTFSPRWNISLFHYRAQVSGQTLFPYSSGAGSWPSYKCGGYLKCVYVLWYK